MSDNDPDPDSQSDNEDSDSSASDEAESSSDEESSDDGADEEGEEESAAPDDESASSDEDAAGDSGDSDEESSDDGADEEGEEESAAPDEESDSSDEDAAGDSGDSDEESSDDGADEEGEEESAAPDEESDSSDEDAAGDSGDSEEEPSSDESEEGADNSGDAPTAPSDTYHREIFSEELEPGSTAAQCPRQAKGGAPAKWDVACVLKIMCAKDPNVVDQLGKTTVNTADDIFWDDPIFDGKKWTTKRFPGGGSADSAAKEITVLNSTSCEDAAETFYHEVWHQNQPAGMGWPDPAEDDAYFNTEQWTIDRGLPGRPSLRTVDGKGKTVPDKAKIRTFVQKAYPSPPPPVKGKKQPVPIAKDDSNPKKPLTKVRDPKTKKESWRPSKKGDTFSGAEQRTNPKTLDPKVWKCP